MSDTLLTGEQKYYSLIHCTYQTFAFDMSVSLLLHVSDTIVFVSYKLNTIDEKQYIVTVSMYTQIMYWEHL